MATFLSSTEMSLVMLCRRKVFISNFYVITEKNSILTHWLGPSWGNIFFKDNDGQVYTLESLKYIIYGPKRPVSAFLYFSNQARIEHKDLKPDAFARLAGDLWRKLTMEEKEVLF